MKKILFPVIMLSVILLTSCGGDDVNNNGDITETANENNNTGNNNTKAVPIEDDTNKEIVQKEIENMPQWAKDEMKIDEPKGIKFVEGISRDRGSQKSVILIYSGDLETLKKEGERLAKKAGLKLAKQTPKDFTSYNNFNPERQGETTDGSKYLKSIDIIKAPDDESGYTLGINIMDAGLIKN